MNAAEHIVEAYFRLCRNCFTLTDRKVEKGVGRQLDLLAIDLHKKIQYHVEIAVTHRINWCPTKEKLNDYFEKKFFGTPPERYGKSGLTDHEKGKSYFKEIESEYSNVGFNPDKVKRVAVFWMLKDEENSSPIKTEFKSKKPRKSFTIEVLSLRDLILPALTDKVNTANYDDEVLRTLSFIKQCDIQHNEKAS